MPRRQGYRRDVRLSHPMLDMPLTTANQAVIATGVVTGASPESRILELPRQAGLLRIVSSAIALADTADGRI